MWKLAKVVVNYGAGFGICEVIKDLALYSGSSLLLWFCLD